MQGQRNSDRQNEYNNFDDQKCCEFVERSFHEVEGGYYDGKGFYCTPDGSFWDENYVYFNREGRDRHGGFYDEYCIYIPGPGWVEELGCYNDEISPEFEDEEVKENIYKNLLEGLVEEFNCNERYFKNMDKEVFDEIDEEFAQMEELEIFNEYVQKHFEPGMCSNGVNSSNNLNISANDENYNRLNMTPRPNVNSSGQKNVSTFKFNPETNNKSNLDFSNQEPINPHNSGFNPQN